MSLYSHYEMPSWVWSPHFSPWESRNSISDTTDDPMFYLMSNNLLSTGRPRNRGVVTHQLDSRYGIQRSAPKCSSCQRPWEQTTGAREGPTERQWIKVLNIGEFGADDVSVKALDEQSKILVEGKKLIYNQGEVSETVELRRELAVPKDVSLDELKVFFRNDRTVLMIAPLKSAKKASSVTESMLDTSEEKILDVEIESNNSDGFVKVEKPGTDDVDGQLSEETKDSELKDESSKEEGVTAGENSDAKVLATKENFQLSVDLSGFAPKNLEVSRTGNALTVRACQNKQHGDWFSAHQVVKVVQLPHDVKLETLKCKFNQEGKLSIQAERKGQQ